MWLMRPSWLLRLALSTTLSPTDTSNNPQRPARTLNNLALATAAVAAAVDHDPAPAPHPAPRLHPRFYPFRRIGTDPPDYPALHPAAGECALHHASPSLAVDLPPGDAVRGRGSISNLLGSRLVPPLLIPSFGRADGFVNPPEAEAICC